MEENALFHGGFSNKNAQFYGQFMSKIHGKFTAIYSVLFQSDT